MALSKIQSLINLSPSSSPSLSQSIYPPSSPGLGMSSKLSVRQILKRSGLFASREAMEQAVQQQRVLYKQKPVPHIMFHIPAKDFLFVDGKPLRMLKKRYFILNKPKQYTCQKNESYPYVADLINIRIGFIF